MRQKFPLASMAPIFFVAGLGSHRVMLTFHHLLIIIIEFKRVKDHSIRLQEWQTFLPTEHRALFAGPKTVEIGEARCQAEIDQGKC